MIKSISMRRRRGDDVSINVLPLIDVLCFLLIFFMVSTSFKKTNQLGVELPQAESNNTGEVLEGVYLNITAEGKYLLDDKHVAEVKILEAQLQKILQNKSKENTTLFILGDKIAPHQAVVSALDVAQKVGLTRVKIVTELKE